ncbi:glutathione S-transferase 3-like [Patella vulgata]|uniref:glutathione S-transferase 3-like n=1 Tax=Patella vulgata TaxID=6465 RepID=UPI0024A93F6A|nr:glutathione S-transferase 3-like [Patella vulgata]
MSGVKLVYFNGRGKAELIRLALTYVGIEFEEVYLKEKSEIEKLRSDGDLLFQQVPLLEIDGKRIVQSGAILRYLARRGGIYGNNNDESTRIDELFEGTRDFCGPLLGMIFRPEEDVLKEAKEKLLPRYLPVFNKVLEETGSGYLVGKSLTLADLGLIEPLLILVEYLGDQVLTGYPQLQSFYKNITSDEKIASFLVGPHRKPKNDQAYVDTVRRVLNW